MRKLISLILAALILAASLAAAPAAAKKGSANIPQSDKISPKITLTSSDAADAAAWLTARLGEVPDRIVIGTSADGYGIALDALEDDGYIIRALGDDVALFARTADGLDRAVRKYAKTVEAGEAVADVTYHEGFRVKRLTIAGRDISAYTVYCEDRSNLPAAASELAARIKEACGASLPVVTGEPTAPYISLRYVHDDTLNTCGYRWSVTDDGLAIECSDGHKTMAPYCAVWRFLETRLGWLGMSYGFAELECADLISIEAGESGGETNAFRHFQLNGEQYTNDIYPKWALELSAIPHSCHGMQANRFGGELSEKGNWSTDQPCYLDDEFYDLSLEDITAYIEKQLAAGRVIGEDFCFVDVAHGDNGNWCKCRKCAKMLAAEGSRSAWILTWANKISEELDGTYPGLYYGVFAYGGTNTPPKTVRPNEHIIITYCFDMSCDMHRLDAGDCGGSVKYDLVKLLNHDNASMSGDLLGWLSMTKNVYVWFYGMDQGFMTLNYVYTLRDNIRFFRENGVKGVVWEAEDQGFSLGKAAKWAGAELLWRPDMTDEEFGAHLSRVLAALYGDGGEYVKEYCEISAMIQHTGACANCWWSAAVTPTAVAKAYAASFDAMFELTEKALRSVDSAKQEKRMTKLSANCIYHGCLASYFDAYEAGDEARVAELSRRYALIETRLAAFGMAPNDPSSAFNGHNALWMGGVGANSDVYESDMEVMAWTSWKKNADTLLIAIPTRPIPERVAAILDERNGN